MPRLSRLEYFKSKLSEPNERGCILWTGCKTGNGYGRFSGLQLRAHRFAWELAKGPIPEGLLVLHKCDVRLCCNPDHLFLGTQAENVADRDRKGRTSKGERHYLAKLSDAQIESIKARVLRGERQNKIAKEYGVSTSFVSMAVAGKIRKCFS